MSGRRGGGVCISRCERFTLAPKWLRLHEMTKQVTRAQHVSSIVTHGQKLKSAPASPGPPNTVDEKQICGSSHWRNHTVIQKTSWWVIAFNQKFTSWSYPKHMRKPIHLATNLSSVLGHPRPPSPKYNVEKMKAPPANKNLKRKTRAIPFNIVLGGRGEGQT